MKSTKVFVMALVAMMSVGFCSCDPENDNDGNTGTVQPNPNPSPNPNPNPNPQPGTEDGWVNLGLPSGVQWAACNVGADVPEEFGKYYAWGETTTKSDYAWGTYKYCEGEYWELTKYCNDAEYGYNGFTDNLIVLQPEDDAAFAWDSNMRMPTSAEWQELIDNTTYEWVTVNGVAGGKFTAANGNSIFIPAAGKKYLINTLDVGGVGYYWSSTLEDGDATMAKNYEVSVTEPKGSHYERSYGMPVRPVRIVRD